MTRLRGTGEDLPEPDPDPRRLIEDVPRGWTQRHSEQPEGESVDDDGPPEPVREYPSAWQ